MISRVCSVLTLVLLCQLGHGRLRSIPLPKCVQECYSQVDIQDIENFVESTFSWTCESCLGREEYRGEKVVNQHQSNYLQNLVGKLVNDAANDQDSDIDQDKDIDRTVSVAKRSAGGHGPCLRREYRSLSDKDRGRFHAALQALKADESVPPNKYDALAILHTGLTIKKAHAGAGFPGWHRIYILMMEKALQEVDPSICLPYWDSSLDAGMHHPASSVVWTPEFFGSGIGPVVDGPFANWKSAKGKPIFRNVGVDGELFPENAVDDMLSRHSYKEIVTSKKSSPKYRLEHHHNSVHVFIGGTMDKLDGSSFDPIFWMHHAYIDFLYERFRQKLRDRGDDPEEYPIVHSSKHYKYHLPDAPTGIIPGLNQSYGYTDAVARNVQYEDPPTCPHCGDSRYLVCDNERGKCLPITKTEAAKAKDEREAAKNSAVEKLVQLLDRPRRSNTKHKQEDSKHVPFCAASDHGQSGVVENDFCMDDVCHASEWVSVAVQVLQARPQAMSDLHGNTVNRTEATSNSGSDLHGNISSSETKKSNHTTFQRCSSSQAVGKVIIYSKGINYDGTFKETVIVDNRLPVSESIGYIYVKKPKDDFPEPQALLRAHDSCGRVCQPLCTDVDTGQRTKCSGAVAISNYMPRQFGDTMDEALMSVFDIDSQLNIPVYKPSRFFLTFYCDYHHSFPFAKSQSTIGPM